MKKETIIMQWIQEEMLYISSNLKQQKLIAERSLKQWPQIYYIQVIFQPWPLLVMIKTEWCDGQLYCPTEPYLLHPYKWESWNKSFLLFPKFGTKSYETLRKIKTSIKFIQKQKHLYIKDKTFWQVVLVSFHVIHEN